MGKLTNFLKMIGVKTSKNNLKNCLDEELYSEILHIFSCEDFVINNCSKISISMNFKWNFDVLYDAPFMKHTTMTAYNDILYKDGWSDGIKTIILNNDLDKLNLEISFEIFFDKFHYPFHIKIPNKNFDVRIYGIEGYPNRFKHKVSNILSSGILVKTIDNINSMKNKPQNSDKRILVCKILDTVAFMKNCAGNPYYTETYCAAANSMDSSDDSIQYEISFEKTVIDKLINPNTYKSNDKIHHMINILKSCDI